MRIGHGYDVHSLSPQRKLILCGVEVPFEKGLNGHSDADAALHALMDALLGAAALGDIGRHFPDSDEQYRGVASTHLLARTMALIDEAGFRPHNIDITIIAQRPKIAPYTEKMRSVVSEILCVDREMVNIKATTEEGLGFTGRGEGIAAHAVCTIEKKELRD